MPTTGPRTSPTRPRAGVVGADMARLARTIGRSVGYFLSMVCAASCSVVNQRRMSD